MGPNPLWLAEWLWPAIDAPPGSRVLDLGCGKALTSIFLAREYGVRVVAADLWIPPTENWARIQAAGCADSVLPIHAEAHNLKFAHDYFDAITVIDAYEYFGTADQYLGYLTRFLRPGGRIGIAEVGLTRELEEPPEHLRQYWQRRGWQVVGGDIDPAAVAAARRNVPGANVAAGDARRLPQEDGSVDAVVSNLPFGQQFTVAQDMAGWQRAVLAEAARVTRPGGRVVLLAPQLPRRAVPATRRPAGSYRIRLLGTWTRLWCFDRVGPHPTR